VCSWSSEKDYTVKNGSNETYFKKKKKVKRKCFRKKTMKIIKIWR